MDDVVHPVFSNDECPDDASYTYSIFSYKVHLPLIFTPTTKLAKDCVMKKCHKSEPSLSYTYLYQYVATAQRLAPEMLILAYVLHIHTTQFIYANASTQTTRRSEPQSILFYNLPFVIRTSCLIQAILKNMFLDEEETCKKSHIHTYIMKLKVANMNILLKSPENKFGLPVPGLPRIQL